MENGFNLMQFVLLAALAESIWETLKMVWEKDKLNLDRLGSIIITIIIAFGTGIDFFELVGLPLLLPYIGSILTGIIASRGANILHDLFKIAEEVKLKNKI
ncbi:MAG: hypothetical protein ACOX6E_08515 [Syntrophomonadaceae bacterium]